MKTLIIPCAGESLRYPNMRPKWMLTHPNGTLMFTESIRGMNLNQFDNIIIVILQKHEDKYKISISLMTEIYETFKVKISVVLIKNSLNQPDTVFKGIKNYNNKLTGQLVIKDCDNYFNMPIITGNSIAVCDIKETTTPINKSYVKIGNANSIVNIAEKQVISNSFCCGAYSFENINEFLFVYEKLQDNKNLYISHIIYQMILNGMLFFITEITDYEDWGTLSNWLAYKAQFKTLFIDLDGVLIKNSSKHFEPIWGTTEAIKKNVDTINKFYYSGKITIIITTARSFNFKERTLNQLDQLGIKYHRILMQIPHSQRILINDFSKTNPYPSALAINLKRNSNNLIELLGDL